MKGKKLISLVLSLVMVCMLLPSTVFAAGEDLGETFSWFGLVAHYYGKPDQFFEEGEPVNDNIAWKWALSYIYDNRDAYTEYVVPENQWGDEWIMPYDVYMAVLDSQFITHSDMKEYLTGRGFYDAEANTVHVVEYGGAGGALGWELKSVHQEGSYYYLQGIMESGDNYDPETDEFYSKIEDVLELTLVETGEGLKIAAYNRCNYYVQDNVLHFFDAGMELGVYYPVVVQYFDDETGFYTDANMLVKSGDDLFENSLEQFNHYSGLWRADGESISFSVESTDGSRKLSKVTYIDGEGEGELTSENGVYTFTPNGPMCIIVHSVEDSGYYVEQDPEADITIKDGVLTYADDTYYQLNFDLDENVTLDGLVSGGSAHDMTVTVADRNGNRSYWSRDHECEFNCRSHFMFTMPASNYSLHYELVPASAGTVEQAMGTNILKIHLSAPATLKVTTEDHTTLTGNNGATMTTTGDSTYYTWLNLVVEELDTEEAETAKKLVIEKLGGEGSAMAFDIHLEVYGKEYPILDGDEVTVSLPIPEGWNAKDTVVYHVAEDGTLTNMNGVVSADGATISFTTTHFSTYVLAQKNHTHSFGDWSDAEDGENHQHVCDCGEVEKQAHTWDEGKVTKEATKDEEGVKTYTCTVCGATKTEAIDKLQSSDAPKTSDTNQMGLWMSMALMSSMALAGVAVYGKKKRAR